jgi:hypothetical protein
MVKLKREFETQVGVEEWCSRCQQDSGVYDFARRCCRMRYVAQAPRHRRLAAYDFVRDNEGQEGIDQMVDRVMTYFRLAKE